MKIFQKMMVGVLALTMFSSGAMAQDNAADDTNREHNGGSFTIVRPEGWMLVAGNLSDKELKKLPENVREHYNMRISDIIFMNISSPDANDKGFKDSLNIVTIDESIPLKDELVKEMSSVLKQQYDSMFESFELESTELTKLNDIDVLMLKGSYSVSGYSIKMEQVLVPSKKESLVLTCTYDSKKERAEEIIGACREAVKSLKFTD